MGTFGFALLLGGLCIAGLSWFFVEVARRDVYTNPKARPAQLREAERVRRELQHYGPKWRRLGLIVAAIGAGLLMVNALIR